MELDLKEALLGVKKKQVDMEFDLNSGETGSKLWQESTLPVRTIDQGVFANCIRRSQDGQLVKPDGCIDPYDKTVHQFGSVWNTTLCLSCNCEKFQLRCCTRYADVGSPLECTPVVNPETCELKLYKKDDPTKLCF
ncbi:small serum protein 2-like [Tiliqua scincoides]|uniref:small serum protein 2-like n=1 Tax=Tiliqua scincoides TaxID=71010 RepID=UPI003462B190